MAAPPPAPPPALLQPRLRPAPAPPPALPQPRALRGAGLPRGRLPELPSGGMRGRGGGRARWPAPVRSLLRAFGARDAAATARGPAQGKRAARGAGVGLGAGGPGACVLPLTAAGCLGYPLRPQHRGGASWLGLSRQPRWATPFPNNKGRQWAQWSKALLGSAVPG